MQVTFWGVRGSIATAGPQFARFGGNTTCLEVFADGHRLILDAGTGLRALGQKMMAEANQLGSNVRAQFLFSHLHWDHIQGFPFFAPAFLPSSEIILRGPVDESGENTLQDALARQMQPPSFPVPLSAMAAAKEFQTLSCGDELEVSPFLIKTKRLNHPNGVLGYRIEANGRSICFATDTEQSSKEEIDPGILELARGVDLLIYDAQYTEAEYQGESGPCRKGWGHSTYLAATLVAKAAGAKKLALFHHDPAHDDEMISMMERDAANLFPACFAAREGATVDV